MKALAFLIVLTLLSPTLYAQSRAPRRARANTESASTESVAKPLPVRRVVLYSNGVAYFERRGRVQGRAEISLSFKQSQVDDVLKSMVVLDLGRGRIGAVSYNSSAPASARLAEIPFSIDSGTEGSDSPGAGGMAAVLRQLQGARVAVTTANRSATGAVINVEERKSQIDATKPPVVSHSLVIASETGEIAAFDLAEVRSVKVLDEGARKDLNDFAAATASARRRDAKTIVVTSEGEGEREMVVSYTIAAPIWKTTYRVVIDSTGKPFFQGWAIVDNVGDEDWTDVRLSLVSGTPISFIQPIQQPLYRYRPVIPIPEDLNLEPQLYEPGVGYGSGGGVGSGSGGGVAGGVAGGVVGGVPGRSSGIVQPPPPPAGPVTSLSDAIADEESGVEALAEGNQVGDLFEYRIDQPMTVRRDRSALIPILQTRLEGERVSIFNQSSGQNRPMSGIRLKNTSPLTFEGGSMTVIDGDAYAGEALIERLKPGEERFITFALDLGTLVTLDSDNDRQPAFLVRAINGVIQAHYYKTEQKTYTVTNQTDRSRTVYVEHPRRDKWKLSEDAPKPEETTENFYRFRVEVGPHETEELQVVEKQALMDSYALSNLRSVDLELFVEKRYIDEETRVALAGIINIKGQIAELDQKIADMNREVSEISSDQSRLRENIKALKETSEAKQLITRYIAKANDQETRLEQIASERKSITNERAQFQSELDKAIRALAFDHKLEGR